MRIEFGFQANCSELVAYLGWRTTEEIVAGMRRIQEITGWTWRMDVTPEDRTGDEWRILGGYSILVPGEKFEELFTSIPGRGNIYHGMVPSELIAVWGDLLPEDAKEELRWMSRDDPDYPWDKIHLPTLRNIPESDPIHRPTGSDDEAQLDLLFYQNEEYLEDGMHLDVGDKEIHSFPIFHKVRKDLGADYTDGTSYYKEWMEYHYLLPDTWELGLSDIDEEEAISRNPPLPGSSGPDEYDIMVIIHDVDLFSSIGPTDGKDILKTMEMMAEVTGYSWWYFDTGLRYCLGIPPNILRTMLNPQNEDMRYGFDPNPLFDHWEGWKGPKEEERKKLKYRNLPTEEDVRSIIAILKERMRSETFHKHTHLLLSQRNFEDVYFVKWGISEPVARIAYDDKTDMHDLMLCIRSYSTDWGAA